jgi:hypothetical protein
LGGGGNGGLIPDFAPPVPPTSGTANTGGGGGGQISSGSNGGSGISVLRYLGAQRGTGGTVVSSGGYTYHYFYTSGTYTA